MLLPSPKLAYLLLTVMPVSPVRNFLYLLLLGIVLLTVALVVRSGLLARKNPGLPINSGMRAALAQDRPELSTQDALIIAVSGYGQPDDLRRSREAGFDHHLVKPIDFDALMTLFALQPG